jgi:hypothetical protein
MTTQSLPFVPMSEGSRCQAHPERTALGTCTRCGVFFCDLDHRRVGGKPYCDTCAVRPDVDYLESFRLKYWGKRDGWAWLVGLGAVANLIQGMTLLVSGSSVERLTAPFAFGLAAMGVCYWLGMRWARMAYVITFVALGLIMAAMGASTAGAAVGGERATSAMGVLPMLMLVGMGVLIMIMALVIHHDTLNKLFFKVEVPREKLKKAWNLYMNNRMARTGLALGLLGLLIPVLGPFALVCSFIGLRRVDPNAHPPIGRKGHAIAGLVLGTLGCLFWGGRLAYAFLR